MSCFFPPSLYSIHLRRSHITQSLIFWLPFILQWLLEAVWRNFHPVRERAREIHLLNFCGSARSMGSRGTEKLCASDLCDALVLYKVLHSAFTGEITTTRLNIKAFCCSIWPNCKTSRVCGCQYELLASKKRIHHIPDQNEPESPRGPRESTQRSPTHGSRRRGLVLDRRVRCHRPQTSLPTETRTKSGEDPESPRPGWISSGGWTGTPQTVTAPPHHWPSGTTPREFPHQPDALPFSVPLQALGRSRAVLWNEGQVSDGLESKPHL